MIPEWLLDPPQSDSANHRPGSISPEACGSATHWTWAIRVARWTRGLRCAMALTVVELRGTAWVLRHGDEDLDAEQLQEVALAPPPFFLTCPLSSRPVLFLHVTPS